MKTIFTFLVFFFVVIISQAQTPTYSTQAGTTNNTFPLNTASNNKCQNIYTPSNFVSLPPSGYVSSIFFRVGTTFTASTQVRTSTDVRIAMGYVQVPDFTGVTTFYTLLDTVYYEPVRTYTALSVGNWVEFPLQIPFYYDNTQNLIVQGSTANTAANQGFNVYNAALASKRYYANYTASTGTVNSGLAEIGFTMAPLAVGLTHFDGRSENNKAVLSWSTSVESNTSHFEIERSLNGKKYDVVGKVAAKGSGSNYSFDDIIPLAANMNTYYRLKMVDLDQTYSLSKTISLKITSAGMGAVSVNPNPFDASVTIKLPKTPINPVEAMVVDATGKTVWSKQLPKGNAGIGIDELGFLAAGAYQLILYVDGERYAEKVVKR